MSDLFEEDVALCGIILAELLHGVNSNKERQLIQDAVEDFKWIPIDDTIWLSVGNNLNLLRRKGLTVPFQDVVLATLCIQKEMEIATNDKHFRQIAVILKDLKVYPTPNTVV